MLKRRRSWMPSLLLLLVLGDPSTTPLAHAVDGDAALAIQFGGVGSDLGNAVVVDADGNVYITGCFTGIVDFDPSGDTSNLTSAGGTDAFVVKLSAAGNLVWARQLGGAGDDSGNGVVVTPGGTVSIAGSFTGVADFDPSDSTTYNLTSAGSDDAFVTQLSPAGDFVWVRTLGGPLSDVANAIVSGYGGSSYTTGNFAGTAVYGDQSLPGGPLTPQGNVSSAGGDDVFVWRMGYFGSLMHLESAGGAGNDRGNAIAINSLSHPYVTGSFQGTADFDPDPYGATNLTSAGSDDVFIWKPGEWAHQLGSTASDVGTGIAVDASFNVYATGSFKGTVDFDPGAGTVEMTSFGASDVFVSKLNSSGGLDFARQLGGTDEDVSHAIAIDSYLNVYTTGSFRATADFDPGVDMSNMTSAGNDDVFVSKLSAAGKFMWARKIGGADIDAGMSVAVDSLLDVFTTGTFNAVADFDPGPGTVELTSSGASDAFVLKLLGPDEYIAAVPARLMDTRPWGVTIDGRFQAIGPRAARSTIELQVTGRPVAIPLVPTDALSVALNVTATGAVGNGFATVYPCGSTLPISSSLNFVVGTTVANAVITKVGTGGKVCVYVSAGTNLIVDFNGYHPAGSVYTPLVPARLMDTRTGGDTIDEAFEQIGIRTARSTFELQITGRPDVDSLVPDDAQAVVLNVTVTQPSNTGYITVYPCGSMLPTSSNLNYTEFKTTANAVIANIGEDGKVCFYTYASTHLIADVVGYYPAESTYIPVGSTYETAVRKRLVDTRENAGSCSMYTITGVRAAGSTTAVQTSASCVVPTGASTVVLNVTAVNAVSNGYLTVYPCGTTKPNASNVNYRASETTPNLVVAKVGADGKVCIFTQAAIHLIIDVEGYYLASPSSL